MLSHMVRFSAPLVTGGSPSSVSVFIRFGKGRPSWNMESAPAQRSRKEGNKFSSFCAPSSLTGVWLVVSAPTLATAKSEVQTGLRLSSKVCKLTGTGVLLACGTLLKAVCVSNDKLAGTKMLLVRGTLLKAVCAPGCKLAVTKAWLACIAL